MCTDQGTGNREHGPERCRALGTLSKSTMRSADKIQLPDSCPLTSERGFTLIELIMFIVIISIALAGILLVMNRVTAHSADPLILKQEIAVAESMLEEIELQDFIAACGLFPRSPPANRATAYHIVNDYNGFATTGVFMRRTAPRCQDWAITTWPWRWLKWPDTGRRSPQPARCRSR